MPLNLCLPSPSQTVEALKKFSHLQSIDLHSFMLDETVLAVLSHPGRHATSLKHLGVLVQYHCNRFPRISDVDWNKLRVFNPDLSVHVTFSNTTPSLELVSFLKPEVPLVSVTFSKYARYDHDVLCHLSSNHRGMLSKFVDYDQERDLESELVELVTVCSSLDTLVYRGGLGGPTIVRMASMRGSQWRRFEVSFSMYSKYVGDEVLIKTDSDEYLIADHLPGSRFYHTDESVNQRSEEVQQLSHDVSKIICRKWKPVNVDT